MDATVLDMATLHAVTRVIFLEEGLHALHAAAAEEGGVAGQEQRCGIVVPCLHVTCPPSAELDPVDILTAWNDAGAWLGPEGGSVVVRSPPGGGQVLVTLYGGPDVTAGLLDTLIVQRIARPVAPLRAETRDLAPEAMPEPRPELVAADTPAEIEALAQAEAPVGAADQVLAADAAEPGIVVEVHVEQLGDSMVASDTWTGEIGSRLQLEGFAIRGTDAAAPVRLEYMAFAPSGRQTRWISDGALCGTRGQGVPLTGFAIRLPAPFAETHDVIYQGAFMESGASLPCSNGAPCLPARDEDVLEAIHVRVTRRDAG